MLNIMLMRKLAPHFASMITISQAKIVVYKSDDQHGMIMTFNRLQ